MPHPSFWGPTGLSRAPTAGYWRPWFSSSGRSSLFTQQCPRAPTLPNAYRYRFVKSVVSYVREECLLSTESQYYLLLFMTCSEFDLGSTFSFVYPQHEFFWLLLRRSAMALAVRYTVPILQESLRDVCCVVRSVGALSFYIIGFCPAF